MNGSGIEGGRTAPPATRLRQPDRLRVKPDMRRPTLLQGGVVEALVRRAVGRESGFAHAQRLTLWSHA